ncbi:hypothetical protein pdam_00021545, partial [Pocillopora damicornis]
LWTVQTSPTTTFPVVTKVDDLKKDTNCFSHYLAIAILSAFLFIVMIILAVVLILLRKKQHQIVFMVSFNFFFICTGDFSRVFQHYQACQTSENDGSRTYTSLVKSTEDSDIEYVNQITAAE